MEEIVNSNKMNNHMVIFTREENKITLEMEAKSILVDLKYKFKQIGKNFREDKIE